MPEVVVPVAPVPKARPWPSRGRVFTPRSTELAEHRIREAWIASGWGLQEGPLYIEVEARLGRPAGHFGRHGLLPSAPRWPDRRPDVDNYGKLVLDALNGAAFMDDAQIVRLYLAKVYAAGNQIPSWRIAIHGLAGMNPFVSHGFHVSSS